MLDDEITTLKSVDKPIPPRNETNLCGLQNQGATCYLNVLIQTLLFTPEFREPLFRLTPKDLNLASNPSNETASPSGRKVRKIIVELQRLFAEMLLLNQQSCSSIRLTDSFGWQSNEAIDHQDVHELNRLLFDAIQKSLQGTKQSNLIRSCYEGSTINYTQCKQCQKIFKRIEDYQDLPLVVQDSPNLYTSLANIFTIHEQLIGDNQYRCSECGNLLCDAEKWAKISKLPPILTLPLQRFVYNIKTGNREKKTTRFEFPFEIDLKEFCEDSVIETNYELFAVVIHKGTCYTGHYYGYIKDIDKLGNWNPPPKSSPIIQRKSEDVKENLEKVDLIKTLLLAIEGWITIEDLLKSYRENTELSWNRTRGSHGSFTKFLRNHPDLFEVDNNRVRLIQSNNTMDIDQFECEQMDYESSLDALEIEHWFCFDDSIVTSVRKETIEKHFQLNDCPYMLFYRRKTLENNNNNNNNNKQSTIPQWLIDEIDKQNQILKEQREYYDLYQNQYSITIYPSSWFEIVDNSRLNLINNNQFLFPDHYGERIFDKRTKIPELISQLEKIFGTDSHFYIAKKLRSGQLHIITELTITSSSNNLIKYQHLIVYPYPTCLSDRILQGEEFEPIMLNIIYGLADRKSHRQITKHISRNTTIIDLKELLVPERFQQIRILKLNLEEKNLRKIKRELKFDEEKQTIEQLHFQDGDTIGIEEKNAPVNNWREISTDMKNQYLLTIKNSIESTQSKPMTYSCSNDTTIGEIKLAALEAFQLFLDTDMCRLHIDDNPDVAHIPLYDHQTIDSVDFNANHTNLSLKFGQSLKENEILLYILSDYQSNTLELIVNETISLNDLLNLIKIEFKIFDNDHHLCEIKSNGNQDENLLNEFDQTLRHNGLTNGSQCILKQGTIPSKNHIRLRILRIIDKIYRPNQAIHLNPHYEMVELDLFELPIISHFNVLREQILTFIEYKIPPGFPKGTQPFEFIRLYCVDDEQPVSIVHEPGFTTLKQAKVKDLDTIAFELLDHPESLAKKDLLLRIVYAKTDRGDYFQHQFELHWPLKENIPAKYEYLEQHIRTNLTRFLIDKLHFQNVQKQTFKLTFARYYPDEYQWLLIDSGLQSSNNNNNKSKVSNLRLDPYRLTDLVVIGVLEGENLLLEDFDTKYDQRQRQEMQEEKRKNRTTKQTNGTKVRRRSPQNTMRIDVDDFEN